MSVRGSLNDGIVVLVVGMSVAAADPLIAKKPTAQHPTRTVKNLTLSRMKCLPVMDGRARRAPITLLHPILAQIGVGDPRLQACLRRLIQVFSLHSGALRHQG
jgi:hypothetical protein